MKRIPNRAAAALISLSALAFAGAASAAPETDFLKRFDGSFSGAGSVSRKEAEKPTRVSCTMKGGSSATSVSMSGSCRAAIIFSRKVSANLKVDASGRYTGTYVGSSIGPAALSGRRKGDAVVLTITWPEEVRGDRTATMTIRNSGGGDLSIVITDKVSKGGPVAQVSSMSLTKS